MGESEEFVSSNSWMIRSCGLYSEEYSDCTSIRARVHQYFVTGKFEDCKSWQRDNINCLKWNDKKDIKAFKEIITSELERRKERLTNHFNNDVWEKRTEPPTNWNDPLPPHIEARMKNSYLAIKAKELEDSNYTIKSKSLCVIS